MDEKKQVEVKLYFSNIDYVLDFIKSQKPLEKAHYTFESFKHIADQGLSEAKTLEKFESKFNEFLQVWNTCSEHVNNLLLLCESYLETKKQLTEASEGKKHD